MFTCFSTALSALNATSTAINVVGNNLANLNSPGFKASEMVFRDLMTQSLGGALGETQVGFGTGEPLTVRQFTQGAIQSTSGLLDAAIQGDGFFILKDNAGGTLYSRAGNFQTDKAGYLLTATGFRVQGWMSVDPATGKVDTNGPLNDIVVPVGSLKPATATTAFTVDLNLNSTAAADATSDFSTPMTVFDSLGTSHNLTLKFEKTAANKWSYEVDIPGEDVTAGTAGTPYPIPNASGTLTFDSSGKLTDPAPGTPIAIAIPGLSDGAADMSIDWDPYTADGTGRITQFSEKSAPSANSQNGTAAADLVHVGLADGGQIVAQYSNGDQEMIGQLALASIRNPDTLMAAGNNNFQLSTRTAAPTAGLPGTGGRGTIAGGSIEASTVDIAREFTNLIVFQRGYQANSRVITTADQLSQDTINLIR
jgi:flagellar hook protein FlgE